MPTPQPTVRIAKVAVEHPPLRIQQNEAAALLGELTGARREAAAIARGSAIDARAICLPLECLLELRGPASRNTVYREFAPALGARVVAAVLPERAEPAALVTTSCTGYHLPGWGSEVAANLGLPPDIFRVPLTEAGCAGGVVAIRCAAQALRHGRRPGIAASVELCSLSLHLDPSPGNLTAATIFGDGAGAAFIEPGPGRGLEIVDALSAVIPDTREMLGFELGDAGFHPILARELVGVVPEGASEAIGSLLRRNCLQAPDIGAWLVHPGGAAILRALQRRIGCEESLLRHSWDSLREFGNTSSASIFDVLRRYLEDDPPAGSVAVVAAFGPGIAIELLLVRAC